MIKITRIDEATGEVSRLQVEGRIVHKTTGELIAACRASLAGTRPVLLDLAGVTFIDQDGARAIHTVTAKGATVIGCSALVSELLRTTRDDASDTMARADDAGDLALLAALQRGDDDAFERLVRLHGGRMLAVARRFLANEEDARDAVQEGFVSAFKAVGEFQGNARLSTWLHRIVVNAALMRLRTRRRKPEASIEDLLPRFAEDGRWMTEVRSWDSLSDLVERREVREAVRRCIDQLPESYRTVVMLRDIEELDGDEAAAALGISANAVKTRLHRARQALRTLLDRELATRPAASGGGEMVGADAQIEPRAMKRAPLLAAC